MRRVDLVALLGVAVLLGAALAYGQRDGSAPAAPGPDLVALREAAALEPCPAGLGPDLPDVELPCLGGGPDVRLDGAPPGPLLVNVWGTWCAPCRDEVPDLVAFAERARGRVGVVGVLTSDTEVSGLAFADEYGIRYPNLVDDDGLVRARYGGGAPLTLFLDARGAVRHVESGRLDSLAQIEALVAEHLQVRL